MRAWSGYQAAKGDGHQSILYGEATTHRFDADAAATLGEQRLAADAGIFSAWLQARAANNTQLQATLVRRFSPEYRTAFTAWAEDRSVHQTLRAAGARRLPEYRNPQLESASASGSTTCASRRS